MKQVNWALRNKHKLMLLRLLDCWMHPDTTLTKVVPMARKRRCRYKGERRKGYWSAIQKKWY